MISEYTRWLLAPLYPDAIVAALQAAVALLHEHAWYFWLLVVLLIRTQGPDVCIWVARVLHPSAFTPPRLRPGRRPLVSVVIAGKNPGPGLERTLSSVLASTYKHLDVIYVDDASTDNSVARARTFERSGRVRVFAAQRHNGKPTNLNIGISMARGTYVFVLDADAEVEPDTIEVLLASIERDPRIGGVAANLLIRNADRSILSRFIAIEFANNATLGRMWRSTLGVLNILPGAGSIFRTSALRELGGYDTGLGDDTDMTIRLQKHGWRLRSATAARVWHDSPDSWRALIRQRARWAKNMVKIRLHKHFDSGLPRYGWRNTLIWADFMIMRIGLLFLGLYGLIFTVIVTHAARPELVTGLYWMTTFAIFMKALIANDVAGTPPLRYLWLIPFYPFYRLPVRLGEDYAIVKELLRIGQYHEYVPRRVWKEIPHW